MASSPKPASFFALFISQRITRHAIGKMWGPGDTPKSLKNQERNP